MRIGEISNELGISRDTLRFYEKRGLIRALRRPNGYRHYGQDAILTIRFILMARNLGFTLSEIGKELPASADGKISAERLAQILRDKLQLLEQRIRDMQSLHKEITALLDTVCPLVLSHREPEVENAD